MLQISYVFHYKDCSEPFQAIQLTLQEVSYISMSIRIKQ